MKEPHNRAKVGYSMIVVSASLATIALIALAIGGNVLFADDMQRDNTKHFNECKANDFKTDGCEKYWDRINSKISGIYVDLPE
ncbi:MAG TPA: hypothetical protein QF518_02220 [Nitrosopumilus sp.]|jgi:hypothetical protein|nr:hypothetical protein [Nitrosopumilus sp.]HJL67316.1 hypothetical protein [Nitrosopumilus sp.]HJM25164.1 hypothetical protein [Nitrosopumilus sp.]HJO31425.1 hypothetical protein [Nitrosopumilus sp.]|tara:strand:+ start:923 stop:1171 length:249 start_codon:yes stop_codon:yes gene_type:complete